MRELFFRNNPWWEGSYNPENIIDRPILTTHLIQNLPSRQIIFLTGLRRVGKTTILKILIRHLISPNGINPHNIFYISLDDYQLKNKSINDIIDEYRKIHKLTYDKKIYLFLDEVAAKESFELQLKNIYDSQNVKVYASSSSASILKSKKTYLTGRHSTIEILPLDFNEYLTFKKIQLKEIDKHLIKPYFEDYMQTGGIPEYVLHQNVDYLKDLVDDIIYKDIAAIHNIRNVQTLKDFFLLLMERSGKIASINKIARILNISPDTAKRYLELFADTYLIYTIPRYGKTNVRLLSPKKVYSADLGIRTYFTGFRDKGSLFENYVFLQIKHLNPSYLYEEGLEIDFLTENKLLIEAKYYNELSGKQAELFNNTKSKEKYLLRTVEDVENLNAKYMDGKFRR